MTTLAIALSRVGGDLDNQRVVCGTLEELGQHPSESFGEPLHSLVIVGKRLHHFEIEYGEAYAVCKEYIWLKQNTAVLWIRYDYRERQVYVDRRMSSM